MNNGVQMEQGLRSITSFLTRSAQVHHIQQTHSKSELTDCRGPGASMMRVWYFHTKPERVVYMSCCFKLSGSALSTSYSLFSLQTLQTLDFVFCSFYSASQGGRGCFLRDMVAAKQKGSKSG